MKGIGAFFERIKNLQLRAVHAHSVFAEALKKQTGIEVPIGSIKFSGGAVVLKGMGPAARSAIFMKKSAILAEFNAAESGERASDIKF